MYENLKVSIVFPTCNGEKYIQQAIESILNQTYQDIELIIILDGSEDRSLEIIKAYKDNRIRLVVLEKNHGHIHALNLGFAKARGDFLTWASDDDYYDLDAIEVMLQALKNNPNVDFVYSQYRVIDQEGKFIRFGRTENPDYLDIDNCIGPCHLWRRKVYETIGDFHQEAFLVEDYEYWLRVREKFRMQKLRKALFNYRLHPKSLTGVHQQSQVQQAMERIRAKFIKPWKNNYYQALKLYTEKNFSDARSLISLSLRGNRFFLPSWRLWALMNFPLGFISAIRWVKRSSGE